MQNIQAGEFLAKTARELLAKAGGEFSPGSPVPLYNPYCKNMLLCALFEFLCGYKSFIGIGGFLLGFRGNL